ncbi:hypothetical protein QMO17_29865, partial [Klebsiella pneumoniae]|nr:hypothetical protein [Klebsiella pneumoniae]
VDGLPRTWRFGQTCRSGSVAKALNAVNLLNNMDAGVGESGCRICPDNRMFSALCLNSRGIRCDAYCVDC